MTLPIFIGNIAVNQAPLSPQPGPGPPPGVLSLVVPSAPPQEDVEAVVGGPQVTDPVSLFTKSHSQQPQPATFGSVPGTPEPGPQDGSPASHPLAPALCISTGATVPYFAEGSGGPVPTTSISILPPEYSFQCHPYGEWGPGPWGREGRGPHADLALSPQRPRRPMSRVAAVLTPA